MTNLVFALLVFLGLSIFFLFFHMVLGKLIRPAKPGAEKLSIYECGEPTVGSAWIQFDVRYYVVALLFVIFDVEVAFFFPWAVVFGTAHNLSRVPDAEVRTAEQTKARSVLVSRLDTGLPRVGDNTVEEEVLDPVTAKRWAWLAFVDILVFFSVLMVGFAYLWRRGDINWVRSIESERAPPLQAQQPLATEPQGALV